MSLYVCPAGETTLLKHLAIVNNAAVTNNVIVRLNSASNNGAILEADVDNTNSYDGSPLFIVLQPGDELTAIATLASAIVTGFGAQLEGTAD